MTGPAVLIVEDDRDTREMIGQFLTFAGYSVRTAENGERALQALQSGAHGCDVILLDLMMPVMNGWQFRQAQAVDPRLKHIPVVVVTASGAREDIEPIDAHGWVSKPVDFDHLLATLDPLCPRS